MRVRVESYSGHRAEEQPRRFYLGERRLEVVQVLDQWYSPDAFYVRLRADDGDVYILRRDQNPTDDTWSLESFRRADSRGHPVEGQGGSHQ